MTKKTILGQGAWYLVYGAGERTYIATTFTFDDANQLVSSTVDGVTTRYTYDAAGRLVKEGNKTYRYGYLDKVMSVSDGKQKLTYDYHADGQIASANYGNGKTEEFLWDGLALVKRGTISYVNEPHPGGGAPVASSNGGVMFNDILGTTLGVENAGGYAPSSMTAFGDTANCQLSTSNFFTGKPHVDGLGHAFLLRNYRADLGKWPTADPLGYPDGWNQMAYCGNGVIDLVDILGCASIGDIDTVPGYESLPDDLVKFTMAGYTVTYDLVGYDIKNGKTRNHIYIGGAYIKVDTGLYVEYWGKFQDERDVESWGVYDCIASIQRSTVLSELAKYSGTIGEIGGWLGVFLKTNPWYDASMAVASAIGRLKSTMMDSKSVRIGQIKRLDSITTNIINGPYDDFLFRKYRQEVE
jgi:RHS repeat-associated protein